MAEELLSPDQIDELVARIQASESEWARERGGRPVVTTGPDGLAHYDPTELWSEITFLAYHLHWSLAELLDLEHQDRRGLVQRVVALNERAWQQVRAHG